MDGQWLQWLVDKAWLLMLLIAEAVRRMFSRVTALEARASAIEGNYDERTRQLNEINSKIDRLTDSVDAKLNMIVSKLIDRFPP